MRAPGVRCAAALLTLCGCHTRAQGGGRHAGRAAPRGAVGAEGDVRARAGADVTEEGCVHCAPHAPVSAPTVDRCRHGASLCANQAAVHSLRDGRCAAGGAGGGGRAGARQLGAKEVCSPAVPPAYAHADCPLPVCPARCCTTMRLQLPAEMPYCWRSGCMPSCRVTRWQRRSPLTRTPCAIFCKVRMYEHVRACASMCAPMSVYRHRDTAQRGAAVGVQAAHRRAVHRDVSAARRGARIARRHSSNERWQAR